MALDRQNVVINFGQGIDTKTDPKQVVQGKLLNLENGIFTSLGRIKKRNGFDALGVNIKDQNGDGRLDNSTMVSSYLDELLLSDNAYMYSYNKSSNTWLKKGALSSISVSEFPIVRNSYNQSAQDATFTNGIIVSAWEDSAGGVRYSIVDKTTEQNIIHDALISNNAIKPKVLSLGNYAFIFYVNNSNNKIYMFAVNILSPLNIALHTDIIQDISTDFVFDAALVGARIFLSYQSALNGICLRYVSSDLTVSSVITNATETATAITVFSDAKDDNVITAWSNGTKIKYMTYSYNLQTRVTSPTIIDTASNVFSITGCHTSDGLEGYFNLYYTISATSKINYSIRTVKVSNNVAGVPKVFLRSVALASKSFLYNDLNYVMVAYETDLQPTYFVVDESSNIVAKILYSLGGGISSRATLPEVSLVDSTTYCVAVLHKDFSYSKEQNIYYQTGIDLSLINFYDSQKSYLHSELAENFHITGGFLQMYDGITPVEHGFHVFPEEVVASNSTAVVPLTFNTFTPTATFLNGSSDITLTDSSALTVGTICQLATSGVLPTNFTINTNYYVVYKSGTVIRLSATQGGGAISAGSTGSGAHQLRQVTLDPAATFSAGTANIVLGNITGVYVGNQITFTGSSMPTNFSSGATYYVISINGTTIQVSSTAPGGGVQSPVIAGSAGSAVLAHITNGTYLINVPSISNYSLNSTCILTTTGTLPVGLAKDTTYYITSINTYSKCITLSLTSNGASVWPKTLGTGVSSMGVKSVNPYCTFTQYSANITVNDVSNYYVDGKVIFTTTSALPGEFTAGTTYYITSVNTTNKTISVSYKKGGDSIVAGSAGSGLHTVSLVTMAAGTYQYKVCYEWTDNKGQIHRSAPSVPNNDVKKNWNTIITLTGSSNAVTLTIPTLRLTAKRDNRAPVRIVVYRTTNNGNTFYQVTSPTSPVLNDYTIDTLTFTDVTTDDDLIYKTPIYTTGEVVENIAAPACSSITSYKNRLVILSSENPLQLWYSKQVVAGTPVEFSDFFTINLDSKGGDITAISNLDDKLIIFKNSSIFCITGTGPSDNGAQNDFSDAQMITTDNGCTNAKSIVLTPMGIMYQSSKGIYLLDRSLQVQYIGAPVEKFNSDTVVASLLISNTTQVRFCLNSKVVLVYDYFVNQWSVFTGIDAIDATIYKNKMVYVRGNGTTLLENTTFTDEGKYIKLKITTSWLAFAGLQGFQRVRRLLIMGEYISPHFLKVGISIGYNPNIAQQEIVDTSVLTSTDSTFGSDEMFGSQALFGLNNTLGEYPLYQWRVHLADQKTQAIQITLEDVQTSDYGEGLNISAITAEVALKKGSWKASAARSF